MRLLRGQLVGHRLLQCDALLGRLSLAIRSLLGLAVSLSLAIVAPTTAAAAFKLYASARKKDLELDSTPFSQ
jgi:hypothetical protein